MRFVKRLSLHQNDATTTKVVTSAMTLAWLCLLAAVTGCTSSICNRATWRSPTLTSAEQTAAPNTPLGMAEIAFAAARDQEYENDPACVDSYFHAAAYAWSCLESLPAQRKASRPYDLYQSALTQLIVTGQRYQRFDPRQGLTVQTNGAPLAVATSYQGFPWQPEDFDELVPVGSYDTKEIKRFHVTDGLGVPVVVTHRRRPDEAFRQPRQLFAATVVLRPADDALQSSVTGDGWLDTPLCVSGELACPGGPGLGQSFVLEIHDPLRVDTTSLHGVATPLKRDLTAPLVYSLSDRRRQYLSGFFQPGTNSSNAGLYSIEPYQPGKIPLVFVHGLLSDPFTWANLANEIRAHRDLLDRYQIWGFEYATGAPFLSSAATLRRQLQEIRQRFDPDRSDPSFSRMVLIGHSMGGLISKLQITYSGDRLWQSVSNRPLSQITTSDATRAKLQASFFFEPVPTVARVVYIGTPHRGSSWAQRPIGKLGASLVREPDALQTEHAQLIRHNPGVFSPEVTRRLPTSIDLLKPTSPLLYAIHHLPTAWHVPQHSIIGSGYLMLGAGDSDRVVPVSSARIGGVATERAIRAKHGELHKSVEGTQELIAILRRHLQQQSPYQWMPPDGSVLPEESPGTSIPALSMRD